MSWMMELEFQAAHFIIARPNWVTPLSTKTIYKLSIEKYTQPMVGTLMMKTTGSPLALTLPQPVFQVLTLAQEDHSLEPQDSSPSVSPLPSLLLP